MNFETTIPIVNACTLRAYISSQEVAWHCGTWLCISRMRSSSVQLMPLGVHGEWTGQPAKRSPASLNLPGGALGSAELFAGQKERLG